MSTMRDLIDPGDGENRAVRAFLMHYGVPGLTVKQQRDNMRRAGWGGCWPDWVNEHDGHLTKAGAQHWLRHLFALEGKEGVTSPAAPDRCPTCGIGYGYHLASCAALTDGVRVPCDCQSPDWCKVHARCARGVDACRVDQFSSRCCERGTKGCAVAHGVQPSDGSGQ